MAMRTTTTFLRVLERAAEQHGFVRTDELDELEVPAGYLRKLAARGVAEQRDRGLYRLVAFPITQYDEFHEAVLWAGPGAVVAGESALALWDLADVNPRRIEVAIPSERRLRRKYEHQFAVKKRDLTEADIDFVDNIPVVTPAVAIDQVIDDGMEVALIEQAIVAARKKDLLGSLGEARLRIKADERRSKASASHRKKMSA